MGQVVYESYETFLLYTVLATKGNKKLIHDTGNPQFQLAIYYQQPNKKCSLPQEYYNTHGQGNDTLFQLHFIPPKQTQQKRMKAPMPSEAKHHQKSQVQTARLTSLDSQLISTKKKAPLNSVAAHWWHAKRRHWWHAHSCHWWWRPITPSHSRSTHTRHWRGR